ncbi:MAG: hypothetical protein KIS86_12325 [Devosia sp.]|nr:hypothetical protein [Devosia sp.]
MCGDELKLFDLPLYKLLGGALRTEVPFYAPIGGAMGEVAPRRDKEEIKSPIRPVDYEPPKREYREVSPGHMVQVWGEDWNV